MHQSISFLKKILLKWSIDPYFSESSSADAEHKDAASDVDFDAAKGILRIKLKIIT